LPLAQTCYPAAAIFCRMQALAVHTRRMINPSVQRKLPILLLIDDDPISREVTATVLAMSDYIVHTAADGGAALEMLAGEECAPDAILMDAQMPGLSGARLIGELRARTRARVYAISASQPPDEVLAAADGFLLKPFDAAALRQLLEGKELQAAPSAPPVLDPNEQIVSAETLAKLRALMPETVVREIYVAVVADLAQRLQALEAAIAKGDAAEVRRIGHAIKGGCGMAGAVQAARLGALFEAVPLQPAGNQLDNNMRLLNALRAATRNLERMLDAELQA
jgi:CheY-like chemotaxis protein